MDNKKPQKNNFLGGVEVLIAGIIWGFMGIFIKELLKLGATSKLAAFFRVFFAAVFTGIIALFLYGPKGFKLNKKQLFWCIINGVFTQGIFNLAMCYCTEECGVVVSTIFLYTCPVFTALFSYFMLREIPSFKKILILGLNILGCFIVATGLDFTFKTITLFGVFTGIICGLTYGSAPVLGKFANDENPNLFAVICFNDIFASLFLLIFTRPFEGVQIITLPMWIYGIIYGVFMSGVTYIFYYDGVKRLTELNIVPVIASIEVVVATLIGIFMYKEKFNVYNFVGIVIVLVSIVLMSFIKKKVAGNDKG